MNLSKALLVGAALLSVVSVSSVSAFAGTENKGADAQAIDSSCTSEAATAGCGAEKVGTGLLKCIHKYKKSNRDFKLSDGCKAAIKKGREDRKERREKK